MINRLINMEISIPKQILETPIQGGDYTIQQYATSFLDGMSEGQRLRFKKMLENGIESGMSVARNYGVDYKDFIKEVKRQLKVKEI